MNPVLIYCNIIGVEQNGSFVIDTYRDSSSSNNNGGGRSYQEKIHEKSKQTRSSNIKSNSNSDSSKNSNSSTIFFSNFTPVATGAGASMILK